MLTEKCRFKMPFALRKFRVSFFSRIRRTKGPSPLILRGSAPGIAENFH